MEKKSALRRWMTISLLGLSGALLAHSAAVDTHVITLDVKVAGESVMTPTLEVIPDKPAMIKLSNADGTSGWSMYVTVREHQQSGGVKDLIAISMRLSELKGGNSKELAHPTVYIKPGTPASVSVGDSSRKVEIDIVSHAIRPAHANAMAQHQPSP